MKWLSLIVSILLALNALRGWLDRRQRGAGERQ
jgi:hypothetical protein